MIDKRVEKLIEVLTDRQKYNGSLLEDESTFSNTKAMDVLYSRNQELAFVLKELRRILKNKNPIPKKIAYCGSLRVALDAFKRAEYESVLRGDIALMPCCMFVDIQREYGADSDYKQKADLLHKRKIDICDEVFILNVNGYIGESTRGEIEYARSIGKPVFYLEWK